MTSASVGWRFVAGLALVTIVIASSAILAQRGRQRAESREKRIELVQPASSPATISTNERSGEMSPESLTSPSLWSKEYIHGPGGRVIATEERVTFTDVAEGSQFYEDIYRIAARGVTLGCGAGIFCPDQNVTRGQMAAFIMRALGEFNPPVPPSQHFADVPGPGCAQPCTPNPFYNFIDRMAVLQITLGCNVTPLNYCPDDFVKHEQMAAFMMRARNEFNPPTPPAQRFNDVPPSNDFYNFIDRMGVLHIWDGCGSNNYCPTAYVTRRQMAHILVKAFGI